MNDKKTVDIKFSAVDATESYLKSMFSFVEITVMGSDNSGTSLSLIHILTLNGEVVGMGTGSSKKRAEQAAAEMAVDRLFPDA